MINPLFNIDFYKAGHRQQYPEGTEMVYSNFTPRSSRLFNGSKYFDDKVVVFGIQAFIEEFLISEWDAYFFSEKKEDVVAEYKALMDASLGPDAIPVDHVEALHDLGYLPLEIRALPEGTRAPMKVPVLTIRNTIPEFFWLVNYLESVMSAELWGPMTSATIAFEYKRILTQAAIDTGAPVDFVPLQAHDFSFRGMSSRETAMKMGMGHLTSFIGTDTVPAIAYAKDIYGTTDENDPIGVSVPATEHSVMCMGTKDGEIETFRRLINELYPTGIVSIVSDTWDFWQVVTEYLPKLKDDIMARKPNAIGLNKVVIRPDSGDPVHIICGYDHREVVYFDGYGWAKKKDCYIDPDPCDIYYQLPEGDYKFLTDHEVKGAIQCLWETFGGIETDEDFRILDEHIGLIYGDSITMSRAQEIVDRLADKGFASTNVVFGVGSYTYQFNTRDTFGFAMKATAGVVNGEHREIFKDPATDSGVKKSARGYLRVDKKDGEYVLTDQCDGLQYDDAMEIVFLNGETFNQSTFDEIRNRLQEEL